MIRCNKHCLCYSYVPAVADHQRAKVKPLIGIS